MIDRNKEMWWSEEYGFFGDLYIRLIKDREMNLENDGETNLEIDGITNYIKLKKQAKILDCPCGYGRHSIGLALKGFSVTGVDINSVHLNKAKEDARNKKANQINFIQENMLNLHYKLEFDAVINMQFSFGYFNKDEENKKVLENFFQALKQGGKFLMHTYLNVPRILSGKHKEEDVRKLDSGETLKIIDKYDAVSKVFKSTWTVSNNHHKKIEKTYSARLYTKNEFIQLCRKVGFKDCKVYSNWLGAPYTEESETIIFVATKL